MSTSKKLTYEEALKEMFKVKDSLFSGENNLKPSEQNGKKIIVESKNKKRRQNENRNSSDSVQNSLI